MLHEVLKIQKKIVPEILEMLEKRYDVLRTIYYNQPVGRRILANKLEIGERIVRTEINFLKKQHLIDVNTAGMTVSVEGENILNDLKDFIHELKGLSDIETFLEKNLNIKKVIVVPGDAEEDKTVKNELGRAAGNYLKEIMENEFTIALTGGSSVKEVIDSFPKLYSFEDILVVPARGGLGRNVEFQANTLAAQLANKINANYKMLHVPDNLSIEAINTMIKEKSIKEVVDNIRNCDVMIYGIGIAEKMALRRGMAKEGIHKLKDLGAVGEAFGYYFNNDGSVVYSTPTLGVKNEDIKKINVLIAIAGGKKKAEAITAVQRYSSQNILITDEGAARQIICNIKNEHNKHTTSD